jgi:hypothetical protein
MPQGNGNREYDSFNLDLLAKTDPLSKFCCRQCGECAPKEFLEDGKFPERIAWLRQHYKKAHPGMWGKVSQYPQTKPVFKSGEIVFYKDERVRVLEQIGDMVNIFIPSRQELVWVKPEKLERIEKQPAIEYLPDSAEFLAQTIIATGYREKLDKAFQEAIERVRHGSA